MTSNNQLSGWTKKTLQRTSQSQTCTKKNVMVTVGWSAAGLIHYSSLNPGKTSMSEKYPQQTDENTPKTAMPATSISQQKGSSSSPQHLTTHHTTNASKIEWIGLWSFASSAVFTWPLLNQWLLLQASRQLFAGKMLLQPAVGRKCFPRVREIPKHAFLCYRNK